MPGWVSERLLIFFFYVVCLGAMAFCLFAIAVKLYHSPAELRERIEACRPNAYDARTGLCDRRYYEP
jgi:hypothetical protein